MSRSLRVVFPGAVYHLTSRGQDRQAIFHTNMDRLRFLFLLRREILRQRWRCHAYCLMTNHIHLLIETPEPNLATGMHRLKGAYAQRFNQQHSRVGHLFEGRYKSIVVDKDSYLLELSRYVVLNPVRAGAVARAEKWPWSSYRATAGLTRAPDWLEVDWLLDQFASMRAQAQEAYAQFVQDGLRTDSPWQKLKDQMWLGDEAFRKRVKALIRQERRRKRQRAPKARRRPNP